MWYLTTMATNDNDSEKRTKATWTAHDGTTTFLLGRLTVSVPATTVDRPNTVCSVIDSLGALNEHELDVVIAAAIVLKRR